MYRCDSCHQMQKIFVLNKIDGVPYAEIGQKDWMYPLKQLKIRYQKPLRFFERHWVMRSSFFLLSVIC